MSTLAVQSNFLEVLDVSETRASASAAEYMMWQLAHGPLLPLSERVEPAIERYREKWGKEPNVVLASAQDAGEATEACGLPVRTRQHIRPGIVWIGRE